MSRKNSETYTIKVFSEDDSFATILLCPLEISVLDLLSTVSKKFRLDEKTIKNYKLSLKIGKLSKVLEIMDKPIKQQNNLLMFAGYDPLKDKFNILGTDIVYLCKFILEKNQHKILSSDEANSITRDYVHVDLRNMDLINIPLVFYQHTHEIEELDVSNNPSIYIPMDFINCCKNLRKIRYISNRSVRFPLNILEAKKLYHLDLQKNLFIELPLQLGQLRFLTKLNLNCNQIIYLPKTFSQLKHLKYLNLSSNQIKIFPDTLTNLPFLTELDLSYNIISYIPETIGNLKHLERLNLGTNALSKSLPLYLNRLKRLKYINLNYNNLSNFNILGELKNLEELYVSKNNVPTFKNENENLRIFAFDRNPITDIIFNSSLIYLTRLNLSKAKLASISDDLLLKVPNVENIVLDKNHIVTLPPSICTLKRLIYLSCFGNNLQAIPENIGNLSSLQYLDLHCNNIQSVPPGIWYLKSLHNLNLSTNLITHFPSHPGNCNNTPRISISESSPLMLGYQAMLPSYLGDSLMVLSMADNRLLDDSFEAISLMTSLKSLNLSYNDLIEIPIGGLRRMNNLTQLYLSGNKLTNFPTEDLSQLENLKELYINWNRFHTLQAELSGIRNLTVLDAGSNQLKYNTSNVLYDWNWHRNTKLKYLNFSGNKRLVISSSRDNQDTFAHLKDLRILGLIDLTFPTSSLPDETLNTRVRTTISQISNTNSKMMYGIADTLGKRENISTRDVLIENFRSNHKEILICLFDGKDEDQKDGHKLSKIIEENFPNLLSLELKKIGDISEYERKKSKVSTISQSENGDITDAIRRAFLSLNKVINSYLVSKNAEDTVESTTKSNAPRLNVGDLSRGCSVTVIYIVDKKLYAANIGDTMALLSKINGDHEVLTVRHDPTKRCEFERIRESGGFVSSTGKLDGIAEVSRACGYFDLLPHIHACPDIKEIDLSVSDEMLVIATKELWEYVRFETVVDVIRQEKNDPMLAAQKLRDYAISYGADDKITVIVLALNVKSGKGKTETNEESILPIKKRRNRGYLAQDSNLTKLEDEIEPPTNYLALVFTDIKNSTLLWDTYPIAMRSAIKVHNAIMRRQLRIIGGYEVKTEGDAFMVSFPTPLSALIWCFKVQLLLLNGDWPTEILLSDEGCELTGSDGKVLFKGLSVRMGIHWGMPVCENDIITKRMDYFGPMVNRAARVSAVADGGQITISSNFYSEFKKYEKAYLRVRNENCSLLDAYEDETVGSLYYNEMGTIESIGYELELLGERKLKGLESPETIWLICPKELGGRREFQKSSDIKSERHRRKGLVPLEDLNDLDLIAIRLEHICSYFFSSSKKLGSASSNGDDGNKSINENSNGSFSNKSISNSNFVTGGNNKTYLSNTLINSDSDNMAILENIITRIENCISMIIIRKAIGKVEGSFRFSNKSKNIDDLLKIIENLIC
ncbi:adenylate cyclase ASCRUDRAFT_33659 [Ascoidea rubescens DSM 1968]|uniref:Adenylate cyclase n=1 Tax=Ascoidea rubescens DSM 1968 TaxID=1344418 RepID=A0A1D2VK47_9ASCO|nr:hypothetical protein ASCRUDRAFT_33659 [Ascoidea rubescens DSM 1968]ODV61897.1 hypothetical protein ASCRUDRAFT_33659 [Ascoidea rubescens DSM 1968]